MDLGDILTPEQINPSLQATNRWEAIDELIGNLVASQKIKPEHREAITAVVKKRESTMSTGIGFGIGIHRPDQRSHWRVWPFTQGDQLRRAGQQASLARDALSRAPRAIPEAPSHPCSHRQAPPQTRIPPRSRRSARCESHVRINQGRVAQIGHPHAAALQLTQLNILEPTRTAMVLEPDVTLPRMILVGDVEFV